MIRGDDDDDNDPRSKVADVTTQVTQISIAGSVIESLLLF